MVEERWYEEEQGGFARGAEVSRADGQVTLRVHNGSLVTLALEETWPCNPAKWDCGAAEDNADLPYLHEPGVCYNLTTRYQQDRIYTWSGLFLIAVNPYKEIKGLYSSEVIKAVQAERRDGIQPHIYAVAQAAWQELTARRQSQAILVTGESGAGKTVNTKHLLSYLTAVTASSTSSAVPSGSKLQQRILEANPILEAFGNASTSRNTNSSRFGKFIRLDFSQAGNIAGAGIQTYLLEKSRLVSRHAKDRSFHIFYQLLAGADTALRAKLLLDSDDTQAFAALRMSNSQIQGIDDKSDFQITLNALHAFGLTEMKRFDYFRIVATVLHLTNIELAGTSLVHVMPSHALKAAARLLGLPDDEFKRGVLHPRVTAGAAKELVSQSRTPQQAIDEIGALCKTLYERNFRILVDQINQGLDGGPDSSEASIGILDIAGFEIFDKNSFEQLLINHTNERLQQLFNAHFFQREQQLYFDEGLEWTAMDYGLNLQPTVDIIEGLEPLGILATLDDECIIPRGSDQDFSRKLSERISSATEDQLSIFTPFRVAGEGFTIRHYAGAVHYSTDGWLKKNRDPLNADLMTLLAHSSVPYIASMFRDGAEQSSSNKAKVKRGIFRTLAQRHREELTTLVAELEILQLHFVRCIVPNTHKRALSIDTRLVLEQLRCNGVIEGLRIARQGFPNRLAFAEFCNRYGVLAPEMPFGTEIYSQKRCLDLCLTLNIATSDFGIGKSRMFFKAGVLAALEARRDTKLSALFSRFQAVCRRRAVVRGVAKLRRREAALEGIQHTAKVYAVLQQSAWWKLFVAVRPSLAAARSADTVSNKDLQMALSKKQAEHDAQQKLLIERLAAQERQAEDKLQSAVSIEREAIHAKDAQTQRLAQELANVQSQLTENKVVLAKTVRATHARLAGLATANCRGQTASVSEAQEALHAAELANKALQKKLSDALRAAEDADLVSAAVEEQRATLEQAVIAAQDARSLLQAEVQSLQRQAKDVSSRLEQSATSNETLRGRLQAVVVESEATLAAAKAEASQYQQKLQDALRSVGEAQMAARRLEVTVADYEQSLAIKETELVRALTTAAESKAERDRGAKDVTRLRGELAALKTTCQAAKYSELTHAKEAAKARDALQKLQATVASASDLDARHSEALTSVKVANDKLMSEIAAMRSERNEAESQQAAELARLRSQNEAMASQLDEKQQALNTAQQEAKDALERLQRTSQDKAAAKAGQSAAETVLLDMRVEHERAMRQTANALEEQIAARDALKHALQRSQELEEALVTTEAERSRRDQQSRQLAEALSVAFADATKLQAALHAAEKRSAATTAAHREVESQRSKLTETNSDLQHKLTEALALQDHKVVQHVHVLEKAKKLTDQELAEMRLALEASNLRSRQLEKDKKRLIAELEDASALRTLDRPSAMQAGPPSNKLAAAQLDRERSAVRMKRSDGVASASSATSEVEARLRRELDQAKKALSDATARRQSLEAARNELLQHGQTVIPARQSDVRPPHHHQDEVHAKRLADANAVNEKLKLQIAEEQSQRGCLEAEMSEKLAKLQRSYQIQLEEASTELDLALSRAARLQEDLGQLQMAYDAVERSGDKRRSLADDWHQERLSLMRRIDFLSQAFEDSSRRQRDGQSRLGEASSEIRDLKLQTDRLLAEGRALADAKQQAEARLEEISSEICETNQHVLSSSEAARILKLERDGLRQQLTVIDGSLQHEQERRKEVELQLHEARARSKQERAESLAAKQHSADLQRLVHTLRLQITDLEGRSVAAASRSTTLQAARARIAFLEDQMHSASESSLLEQNNKLQEDLQSSRAHATMLEAQCSRLELAVRQHDTARHNDRESELRRERGSPAPKLRPP